MNTENNSKVQVEVQTFFIEKGPLPVVKTADVELKSNDLQNNGIKDDALSKDNADFDDRTAIPNSAKLEITIWRNRKICINKSLISLRAALFLWFGSGNFCSPFFSLMLTQRGLKLTEFSSVFSIMFVFQIIVGYISGVIVDKLGNAKLVLSCLMLLVISVVIALLLSPNVREKSCLESGVNITCFKVFNNSSDLERCKYSCSINNTDYFISQAVNNKKTGFSTFSNATDVFRSKEIIDDAFYSNSTIIFCNAICSCFDQSARNCSTTSKDELNILYAALTLCFFTFWSTTYRFLDLAALTLAKQQNSTFGYERVYGLIGTLVASVLVNFVLNIDKSGTRGDYDKIYWFAVLLFGLALISVFTIREIRLPQGVNMTKKTLKLFTNIKIITLTLVVFVAGTAFTFSSFYHLWFLDSLKASKRIIGFHTLTYPVYGLPMYLTSNLWLRKLGRKKIIIVGLLSYAVNGTSYSFLYYPWLSLVIEITKAFSFHLFWIATVIYCGEIAPKGFAATLNAVVGTVHFGIGQSFSVSVGGYLINTYGARTTYRILAGFCLITAILYTTFAYLKHLFSSRDSEKQSKYPEEMENMRENEA